jgi:16S rRNA (guanine527-N7)-methyltransferase
VPRAGLPRGFRARLLKRAQRLGLSPTPELTAGLVAYYELLVRWNERINLTALHDTDLAIDRLLLEPLVAARHVRAGVRHLLDVGSGGGSPAIPLKLALPAVALTMVESKARKSVFLREVVRALALPEVSVETARYEELLASPAFHETADVVSLRAVRLDGRALMNLQAFLRPGGRFFLFRAARADAFSEALPPALSMTATVPLVESLRSQLVIIQKLAR